LVHPPKSFLIYQWTVQANNGKKKHSALHHPDDGVYQNVDKSEDEIASFLANSFA
jgi:hypothetical protein